VRKKRSKRRTDSTKKKVGLDMRKKWWSVVEWHPMGVVITLVEMPREMGGIWIVDYTRDGEEINIIAAAAVCDELGAIVICDMVWAVIEDFKSSLN
jgi:hypothetical protein